MRVLTLVLFVVSFLGGCKQSKQVTAESKNTTTIENGWEKTPNAKSNYFLYVEVVKDDVKNPRAKRQFYVADADGNKVIEESIYGGYVKWVDDLKVEYFSTPGVLPSNHNKSDYIMIYDIMKEESYVKSSDKNQ